MNEQAHETSETLRKAIHIAFGFGAIALRWIPWRIAAGICGIAVITNWLLLHRLVGRKVARHERGFDAGILLYPFAVGLLILTFNWHLDLAAVAWAILAFGDGFATLVGRAAPLAQLPWNRAKSWGGVAGFLVAASIGAIGIARLFGAPHLGIVIAAVLVSAIVESLPTGVDDNITIPLAAGATLATLAIQPLVGSEIHPHIVWGWVVVNTVLAVAGYALKLVDLSGAVVGWLLGDIAIAGNPAIYAALLAFFIIGSVCTKIGYAQKAAAGLAQEKGGRRSAEHAFANAGVAAICAIAHWRGLGVVPLLMGVAALATAAADTASSEIGKIWGKRAFTPLRFRSVPRGTPGAVSLAGTIAGLVASFGVALAGVALAVHRIRPGFTGGLEIDKSRTIAVITACGFLGAYLESVAWTATRDIPHTTMNFLNTAAGAYLFWFASHYIAMWTFVF